MAGLKHPLDFEKPLVDLESQLAALGDAIAAGDESRRNEFAALETKVGKLRKEIYGKLTAYQRVQLSRHFDRPFTLDFAALIFTHFVEFHGDRQFGEDAAIVGGTARLGDVPVMIVGHQRGRSTAERLKRNFGMARPEGFRKALRLFHLADKFNLPIITFIDTNGAFPGIEAEERGQAEAIARNLYQMAGLRVPVVSVVIGEGGSGGALALGVANRILMLANACYSVITPEGCAAILWNKDRNQDVAKVSALAAEALRLTAGDLKEFGVVDEIVPEPMGGAHNNHKEAAEMLRTVLVRHVEELRRLSPSELVESRYRRFRALGVFTGES